MTSCKICWWINHLSNQEWLPELPHTALGSEEHNISNAMMVNDGYESWLVMFNGSRMVVSNGWRWFKCVVMIMIFFDGWRMPTIVHDIRSCYLGSFATSSILKQVNLHPGNGFRRRESPKELLTLGGYLAAASRGVVCGGLKRGGAAG